MVCFVTKLALKVNVPILISPIPNQEKIGVRMIFFQGPLRENNDILSEEG